MKKILLWTFAVLPCIGIFAQQQSYTVKENEAVNEIAKIYRVSPADILKANPEAQSGTRKGMVLIIPGNNVQHYNTQRPVGFRQHTVEAKETLFGLSQLYSIAMDDLKRYNFVLYERGLQVGEELTIPIFGKKTEMVEKGVFGQKKYVVKPKEGLWRIAQNHQTTQDVLQQMNPGITESNLKEGQEIWVPSFAENISKTNTTGEDAVLYTVEKAEGFYSLERKFGLTEAELIRLNPELSNGIKAETQLWIPKSNFDRYRNSLIAPPDANYTFEKSNQALASLSSKNNVRHISFVLPFRVSDVGENNRFITLKDRLDNDKITPLTADFYSGAMIALDSLQRMGYAFQVNVFDSEASDRTITNIAENQQLNNSQLIIGPFLPKAFNALSEGIKDPNIALLAPLSNKNIELRPNVYQTLPTDELQQNKIIEYAATTYPDANILIMADSKNNSLREKLERNFPNAKVISTLSGNAVQAALDNTRNNLVFIQSNEVAYVSNVLQLLHNALLSGQKTKIILMTAERGSVYDNYNISNTQLSDLQFTYPTFNRYSNGSDSFSKKYFATYGILPSKYAVRGFDLTMDAVLRLGVTSQFEQANMQIGETSYVENKFAYLRNPNKGGGYENQGVYIVRYENLEIKDVTP
ncbi:MAG: LysM peptidoglycan-binding domain-containing protein [Capnocytophaga sp.]|nr:LysM peptidoglycan-binding domain-containing protein [Capnocytophaga sp.]